MQGTGIQDWGGVYPGETGRKLWGGQEMDARFRGQTLFLS